MASFTEYDKINLQRDELKKKLLSFQAESGVIFFFFFLRFYLFIHGRHKERGGDTDRGRSRLPTGSPMWNSILGPRDHDLSQRQTLNH